MANNVPEILSKSQIDKILRCQCINCGGHLETADGITYKCLYCDTKYTVKEDAHLHTHYIVEVVHPNMITLGARLCVPRERLYGYNEDTKKIFIKREISRQLTDYFVEHFEELVDIEKYPDFERDGELYEARLRMLHSIGNGGF